MEAARENRRDPLMTDQPNASVPEEMVKVIKSGTREIEAKPNENAGASAEDAVRKGGLTAC